MSEPQKMRSDIFDSRLPTIVIARDTARVPESIAARSLEMRM